jgi:hypothetical protein
MKLLRNFLTFGSIVVIGGLTFSCVDESYDLEKADYQIQLLKDGISLPVGMLELSMDSILKVDENSSGGLKVKNNAYYFSINTPVDLSGLNSTISNFSLTKPTDIQQTITIPTNGNGVGYSFPAGASQSYSSAVSSTLPNFTTTLIEVKRVQLKNTTFTMVGTTSDLGGTNRDNSITITCTPQDNVAEYYIGGVKVTSWSMQANESRVVEIRNLDVTSSSTISINCVAAINVATDGALTFTGSNPRINVSVQFNSIDFETVYGKITYSKTDSKTDEFEGFGELLGGDQNVLSLYNPTIKFKWNENLGVPINVDLGISARNTISGRTASLTNSSFTMDPVTSPTLTEVDSFTIDRNNGTSELLKINPNEITTSYSFSTDASSSNRFISKNTQLSLESILEVPVQFGSDLLLNVSDTIDNPFTDVLDKLGDQEDLGFGVTFSVANRIPLGIKIRLTAESEAGDSLFMQETGTIAPAGGINANGFATQETATSTSLTFTPANIDKLKDVARFKVNFIVTATTNSGGFVTISPQDYIRINVGAIVTGGMILDLNKEDEDN